MDLEIRQSPNRSKYPPALPEDLCLMAPQKGLTVNNPCAINIFATF